jgi:hypothetical protein
VTCPMPSTDRGHGWPSGWFRVIRCGYVAADVPADLADAEAVAVIRLGVEPPSRPRPASASQASPSAARRAKTRRAARRPLSARWLLFSFFHRRAGGLTASMLRWEHTILGGIGVPGTILTILVVHRIETRLTERRSLPSSPLNNRSERISERDGSGR